MATTINADTSEGLKLTSDTSGELELQSAGVTKVKITSSGLQNASGNPITSQSGQNLIINGDMRIAQRGTSVTGIAASGYYTVDRWSPVFASGGIWTNTQDTDVPTGQGFANSFKLECTTAVTSLTASAVGLFRQAIEGQNLQQLKKGTANAESITLSFWVKSNKTGTYILELYDSANTRQISKSYTINTADTWEKKTITFDGDTTGTLNNDNGIGIYCQFWIAAGSDRSSGTLSTSWSAQNNPNRAVGQVNLADSTSNYINITGIQLEVGTTETPFQHLQYGQQLALCQRYYYLHASGNGQAIGNGTMYTTSLGYFFIDFPVTLRGNPALEVTNITAMQVFQGNSLANPTAMTIWTSYNPNVGSLRTTVARNIGAAFIQNGTSGDNRIAFDSEL